MILCHALLAAPLHLTRCRKTFFTADSLAFPDILPFPLLSRHRLSADLLALLYLHAVDEHAEVSRPAPRACREASRAVRPPGEGDHAATAKTRASRVDALNGGTHTARARGA